MHAGELDNATYPQSGCGASLVSDLLKHVVVADSIGVMLNASEKKTSNVGTAFTLGVVSHALMDVSEPDYTVNWFDFYHLGQAAPFLGLQVGGFVFVMRMVFAETRNDPRAFRLRMAAIIGAVIPDIIDGIYSVLNPHAWYSGQLLLPWHNRTWQVNPMSMWATSALTLLLLAVRYLSGYVFRFLRRLAVGLFSLVSHINISWPWSG